MNKMIKRILSEINSFQKDTTIKNAFIHVNEENVKEIDVMIIGDDDTPYCGGYFLFKFEYPNDYPSSPIKVIYKTTFNGSVRFNPNLYANGKVCLSLINTWGSNDWSPANTLTSVILSIQSLILNKYPLRNEPAYNTIGIKECEDYNNMMIGYTVQLALAFVTDKIDAPKEFIDIAKKNFNIYKIIEQFAKYKYGNTTQVISSYRIDVKEINKTISELFEQQEQQQQEEQEEEEQQQEEEEEDQEDKCNICFERSDQVSKLYCCSFRSCKKCLEKWLKKCETCPLCKRIYNPYEPVIIPPVKPIKQHKPKPERTKSNIIKSYYKYQDKDICVFIYDMTPEQAIEAINTDKLLAINPNTQKIFSTKTGMWSKLSTQNGKHLLSFY